MRQPAPPPTAAAHTPAEPLADDASARIGGGPPEGRPGLKRYRATFTALALAFFLAPLLIILAGRAGGPLPSEHPASAPQLGQGWTFFDDASLYLTQQLPLRARAVTAYNWISRMVFGSAPRYGTALAGASQPLPFATVNPATNGGYAENGGAQAGHPVAAIGRDGWYFLQAELDALCSPPIGFATAIERWGNLIDTIHASGRRVVLLIVPEKSTIYPEYVAPHTINWSCAWPQKQRLWSQVEAVRSRYWVPLRQPLLNLKRQDPGRLLYLPLDSHWNDLGSLLLVKEALRIVGGRVQVAPGDVHTSTKPYTGDITTFTGTVRSGVAPAVTIQRGGDDQITTLSSSVGGGETTHPGGPRVVIPGTTLFLKDSYGDAPAPLLKHYAGRLTEAAWLFLKPAQIAQLIRQAHTVIIETVERDFLTVGLSPAILSASFLQSLRKVLATQPASG